MSHSRTQRLDETLTVLLFAGFFLASSIGSLVAGSSANVLAENRRGVPFPAPASAMELAQGWPARFDGYFKDRFGARRALLRVHNFVKLRVFGVSPTDRIVVGRDGWFFYTKEKVIEDYRNTHPLKPFQLERYAEVHRHRRDRLAERGIRYLVAVAPNKHTIYPEHLPSWVTRRPGPSRYDQLVERLGHDGVAIVDLRPSLLSEKRQGPVYYRYDTHWNAVGAHAAYVDVMTRVREWFPAAAPLPREAFTVRASVDRHIGWLTSLGLGGLMGETVYSLQPRVPIPRREGEATPELRALYPEPVNLIVSETDIPAAPRLLMFHDSFGEGLIGFLAPHFRRAVFVHDVDFNPAAVEAERPDVVVCEIVERYLMRYPQDRLHPDGATGVN